jgi:hypothetical protein
MPELKGTELGERKFNTYIFGGSVKLFGISADKRDE